MKKWKFCSSLSFILTGLILTIVLCHKQDHSYMIIFPQLLIFIGIALHLKITHQDYESAFKEIIRFLVYSAVFLIAILLLIQIYFSKEALLIFIFIIFSGFFLFASIRYFANVCYTLLKSIRQAAATKNQKAEFVMWVVTFLSSVATIISLLIALSEFMIHEIQNTIYFCAAFFCLWYALYVSHNHFTALVSDVLADFFAYCQRSSHPLICIFSP